MTTTLIRGGRIIDPSQDLDRIGNLLIRDGRIAGIVEGTATAGRVIDATGLLVVPGLVDLHVSLREPGFDEDETIATGTAAALAGGFTSIACMPDTSPPVDERSAAEFVLLQAARARNCHVFPIGAVTRNHEGAELADIGQLVDAGAVAFSDVKQPVANAEIMRRALEYTRMFDRPVFSHPQVPELVANGIMHEGEYSTLIGFRGMPAAAEEIMVGRDVALAELTRGRVHVMTVSTAGAVEHIRRAKSRGLRVTAEVTPHHLTLTDASLRTFESHYKVDPPLRTEEHIEALIAGLKDGTIDAICSDHQPFSEDKCVRELNQVPFGIVGLETLLPVCIKTLIEPGHLTWPELIRTLTCNPARILGIPKGTLRDEADADVTLIDPECSWTIDPARFRSKSRNTPFAGWNVKGRAHTVIVGGEVRYRAGDDA